MTRIDPATIALIDETQARYVATLDSRDMQGWLECFDGDGSYICRTAESEERGLEIALILDDCHDRLKDRVQFVTRVWAGTFQDYQTRHFVQRLSCTRAEDGSYNVRSNFAVMFTRSDTGVTQLLASGVYLDTIMIVGDAGLFRSKKTIIDAPILPHYMVYPL